MKSLFEKCLIAFCLSFTIPCIAADQYYKCGDGLHKVSKNGSSSSLGQTTSVDEVERLYKARRCKKISKAQAKAIEDTPIIIDGTESF